MNPLTYTDRLLNSVTMYRLLLYGLSAVAGLAVVYAFTGLIQLPVWWMLASLGVLLCVGYAAGWMLAVLFEVPANYESSLITTLILFLIMPPAATLRDLAWLAVAELVAVGSKYVVAWHGKHIFNPAAFGAGALTVTGLYPATWWVGTPVLLPAVLVLGLLEVRKVRRFSLIGVFFAASVMGIAAIGLSKGSSVPAAIWLNVASGPLIFFGTVMVTEPSTMPGRRNHQIFFGAIVGLLAVSQAQVAGIYISSLVALLVGNLYACMVNSKNTVRLKLVSRNRLSERVFELVFVPDRRLRFLPGQYMDWTLPISKPDNRGNRRTFTIASSPTEPQVRLGIKLYEPSSAYKREMMMLQPGDVVLGAHVAGDFIMPRDAGRKLVFIAGGIGVTPFRSMAKSLIDAGDKRDIVMFYTVSSPDEVSFADVFGAAEQVGLKLVPVLDSRLASAKWNGERGPLTAELVSRYAPDMVDRYHYISGPSAMVDSCRGMLREAGVPGRKILSDWFTGY